MKKKKVKKSCENCRNNDGMNTCYRANNKCYDKLNSNRNYKPKPESDVKKSCENCDYEGGKYLISKCSKCKDYSMFKREENYMKKKGMEG